MFVLGGYFGGRLRVARGRPSVRERERGRGREDRMVRRRARKGGRAVRCCDTGLRFEGLGGIGRVQGGPWRGRRLVEQVSRSDRRLGEVVSGGARAGVPAYRWTLKLATCTTKRVAAERGLA